MDGGPQVTRFKHVYGGSFMLSSPLSWGGSEVVNKFEQV